ncbi:nSTAND1 domain-containing NTPase [Planktothrix agardhii]|uniref:Putative WD40 repeat-containing protein n=1 Tax=Planktothrix agardhii (strain NIVA-CYA 126/8) TaxID=388467 RepID=A0A073CME5_PLAA1|nr:TIR domain-containing protein [Planktothrix agardhii]KEI68883.1 putative WD40 repeat-containing protein [Planktothrix agardhii NIVA-CYA 126/8]CAD5909305.1 putative WD repeat-containing protein all2124 [Planktothrix agardhii]
MSKQYSVFVSYADEDDAWVEGYLLNALEEAGLTCHSEAMFRLGVPRLIEFESAVKNSERTLLVISPAYLADNFVEFANLLFQFYGLDTNLWPVVGIILHPVQELPMRLKMLECLDATDGTKQQKAIQRICENFQKPVPTLVEIPDCPYPGMVPFKPEDSDRFFGRQREVNDLIQHLRLYPFVAVIGASGSGKSSLVFAGLIPQLQKTHLLGKEPWQIYSMRPGTTPITTLTTTLGCDLSSAEAITTKFKSSQKSLLVIDQFEEIFTLSPQDVTPFQEILLNLYKQPNFYVVLTVRADFYPQLMESTCFWREIKAHRYEVLPLDQMGLQEAILKPAEQARVFIEGTLLERLITTAAKEPGVLPLLQETLVLLWEKIERRYLPLRAYEALVLSYYNAVSTTNNKLIGIQVALAQRADAAIANLTDEQQIIARRVFLRLIQFGEGRADTRRQESVEALKARGDNDQIFEETLRDLADRRLLTLSGKEDKTRKVDISHEILISSWPQLQDWIIQRRDAEQTRRRLIAKVEEWVRLGKGQGGLLDEFEIVEAQHWLDSSDAIELGSDDKLVVLVELSKTHIETEKQREIEAQKRELKLSKKNLWITIIALTVITGVATVAIVVAGIAKHQWQGADKGQIIAKIETANARFTENPDTFDSLVAALEAGELFKKSLFNRNNPQLKADVLTVLAQGLNWVKEQNRWLGHTDAIQTVSFSPDGEILATGGDDNIVKLWHQDGSFLQELSGHQDAVMSVNFSPDGDMIATASLDKTVRLWQKKQGKLWEETVESRLQYSTAVHSVSFSKNGEIAIGLADGSIDLRKANGTQITTLKGHNDTVRSVSFSPNGQTLATASADQTVILWRKQNNQTWSRLKTTLKHDHEVFSVSFSPDGQTLASASLDGTIKLWNSNGIRKCSAFKGHNYGVLTVAFSPDSQILASAGEDYTIKLWNLKCQNIKSIKAHNGRINGIYFNPQLNENILASVSNDKFVKIWQLNNAQITQIKGYQYAVRNVEFSPVNEQILVTTNGDEPEVKIWDTAGNLKQTLDDHKGTVRSANFNQDGTLLGTVSDDQTAIIWDLKKGSIKHILSGHTNTVRSIDFSADNQIIATTSYDGTIKLWNQQGKLIDTLEKYPDRVYSVSFSPILHEKLMATASEDGTIKLRDLKITQSRDKPETSQPEAPIYSVAFSPDGTILATGSGNNQVQLWNLQAQKIKPPFIGHQAAIGSVAFSPKGRKIIASGSDDKTINLWTLDGTRIVTLKGHQDEVNDVSFSHSGQTLASASSDHTVILWNVDTVTSLDQLLTQGCNWLKNYLENSNDPNKAQKLCSF